jgi:hypothetical protein
MWNVWPPSTQAPLRITYGLCSAPYIPETPPETHVVSAKAPELRISKKKPAKMMRMFITVPQMKVRCDVCCQQYISSMENVKRKL